MTTRPKTRSARRGAGRPKGSTGPRSRPEARDVERWHALGYLMPPEVAERVGCAKSTVYNRIRSGAIGGTHEGKKVVVKTPAGMVWVLAAALPAIDPTPESQAAADPLA